MSNTRLEHDSLGSKAIPNDKYYGTQTVRALENFPITHISIAQYPKLVYALGAIKEACAKANHDLNLLSSERAQAIIEAAKEVQQGKLNEHFPIDVIQGGAGTSTNMNANEVIANRALEIMGHQKGEHQYLHPNNHVNLSQSTNDVYPTACKIALNLYARELLASLKLLTKALFNKAQQFEHILKMGRTQLQDAVPMTLGQEFNAFGNSLKSDIRRLEYILSGSQRINMGATAIGTGINTVPGYSEKVCLYLSQITDIPLALADDLIEATSDTSSFVEMSSVLKRISIKLTKTCNDLRLLASGPLAGLREINLPAVQPGSSIMPGKINPVMPEMLNQICFQIIGSDTTIAMASSSGQLQLNAFEPIMFFHLAQGLIYLKNGVDAFRLQCIDGITAEKEHCENTVMRSAGLITAFSPYIGYEEAARIAKEAQKGIKTVYELVHESGLLSEELIEKILSPAMMTSPHDLFTLDDKA